MSSFLQYLVALACLVLATQTATLQSYRSFKTVLSTLRSKAKIEEKCLPTCIDENGDPIMGAHIRDPTSCHQYWICMPDGTLYEHPHLCPEEDGEIVNVDTLVCEPEVIGSDQCTIPDPDCDPSIPKICYTKDTCPPSDEGVVAYADENDCNKYHVCHFSATLSCPDGQYFDGQGCGTDKTKCCECQAVCREAWSFIQDPTDTTCNSYYLCQDLESRGYPYIATDEEKFACPEGEKIDITTGLCSDSASCETKPNCVTS